MVLCKILIQPNSNESFGVDPYHEISDFKGAYFLIALLKPPKRLAEDINGLWKSQNLHISQSNRNSFIYNLDIKLVAAHGSMRGL